jgi:molybdopterin molybdotransferase
MIGFNEAIEVIRSLSIARRVETVSLAQAAGRVLAEPVRALIASPRSNVSSMDGYAVRDADLKHLPARLRVVGSSYAGAGWNHPLEPGTCIRIFTGAPVPQNADRVVIQEIVRAIGDEAIIEHDPGAARFVRMAGSDFDAGDELLSAGRLLDARALVAAAGADVATLKVHGRPRIRILGTGDELAEPGTARDIADAIPESVTFGVAAMAEQAGASVIGVARLRDELVSMQAEAQAAFADAEVLVVTGGASVGEKDYAKAMFEPLGLELLFSKVAIKPGKPVWLGRVGDRLVLGLPGNPTSAMVTARLFLLPLLAVLTGRSVHEVLNWRTMPLASPLGPCGDRETFHRARLQSHAAEILTFQDSSAQHALASADLLVRQAANAPAVRVGDTVEVLDF